MRILLIEDDVKLTALLKQGLKEQGFGVDVCEDGPSGLAQALSTDYDALVLDLMLPGRNGLEVLAELREHKGTVPVLILTARSAVEDRVRGLDGGADDYLLKPFELQELLARLRAITRRPAVEPRIVLRAADLALDTSLRQVARGDRKVDLTNKEYALLEYLLRKKNVVVTRGMILNHVWDLDYDGGTNLVEVYVNYLRRKIDHDFEPKLIRTVHGVGYVLQDAG